jgi:hypothetical protein
MLPQNQLTQVLSKLVLFLWQDRSPGETLCSCCCGSFWFANLFLTCPTSFATVDM